MKTIYNVPEVFRTYISSYLGRSQFLYLFEPVISNPRFADFPASIGGHHAYSGGLATHTLEVLEIAAHLSSYHFMVNKLVLALGCVWHDAGKLESFAQDEKGCYFEIPGSGHHIDLGVTSWERFRPTLIRESVPLANMENGWFCHVRHLIASHHGPTQRGSKHPPRDLESVILHHADVQSSCLDGHFPYQ